MTDESLKFYVDAFHAGEELLYSNADLPVCWEATIAECFYKNIPITLKPKVQKVDMSVLVNSGVLCEFTDFDEFPDDSSAVGFLLRISATANTFPYGGKNVNWRHCRPALGYWHYWTGGDTCPVPEGVDYEVQLRSTGTKSEEGCHGLGWGHIGGNVDIIAWRAIGLLDGWKW